MRAVDRRAFVIVLDACGAGELPDSADYGDAGANTLGHVAEAAGGLDLPVLQRLGLGSALPLRGLPARAPSPSLHGRLHPLGPGKDTITGPLGADGRDHAGRAAHLPGRLPGRGDRAAARRDRPRRPLQPARTRAPR